MTEVTGGQLLTLWKVGRVELPTIAQVYLDAIGSLETARGIATTFFGPAAASAAEPTAQPTADAAVDEAAVQVGPAWQRVCDELADALSLCARDTLAAGDAVALAIAGYTGTDADGTGSPAGPGQDLWRKIHDPNEVDPADPDQNPPAPSPAGGQPADGTQVGEAAMPPSAEPGFLTEVTQRAESITRLVIEKQKANEDAFRDFATTRARQYRQDVTTAWDEWDRAYRDWHKERQTTKPARPDHPAVPQSLALPAALAEEYEKHLVESYAWIVPAFQAWAAHDPDILTPGISAIKAAEDRLADGQAIRFANSAQINLASQWDGGYCTSLRNFLASFLIMPGNQQTIARTLRELLEAEQALYRQAQGNMLQLAEKAEEAIKTCGTQNRPETRTYLTILSAVTWIAAAALAIPSGGASIYAGVVTFNAVAAVSGAAANLLPGGDPKSIGADKIDDVLANVSQVMAEARAQIAAREQDIVTALEHNHQTLATVRQRSTATGTAGPVTPSKPAIINASARQIADHLHPK